MKPGYIFLSVMHTFRKYKGQIPMYLVWYIKQNTWGTFRADISHGINTSEVEVCGQNFKSIDTETDNKIEW